MPRSSFSIAPCLAGQSATPSAAIRSLDSISNDPRTTDNSQGPLSASFVVAKACTFPEPHPQLNFWTSAMSVNTTNPNEFGSKGELKGDWPPAPPGTTKGNGSDPPAWQKV